MTLLYISKYLYSFLPFYLNTFYAILSVCIMHQLNELLYIRKRIVLLDVIVLLLLLLLLLPLLSPLCRIFTII
jgi:hypothetical protein